MSLKTDNLQYNTLGYWVDGMNDSSNKHLLFQALFFFTVSYRLRALKTLDFYYEKINLNNFCKEFYKKLLKKIILGTSEVWSMICLSHCSSEGEYYIVDCRIS